MMRFLTLSGLVLVLGGCQLLQRPGDCANGKIDGRETDLDCGGSECTGCNEGRLCLVDPDCATGVCTLNRCAAPTCIDGVRNGAETGVDCGGPCGPCTGASSCGNQVRDGEETDVDCGGPCPVCPSGGGCVKNADCTAGTCVDGVCGAAACPAPLLSCGGACVDPRFDRAHCGGCGVACAPNAICGGGQCLGSGCGGGTLSCGGACVDPLSNPQHCGGCNQPCQPAELCVGGTCVIPCAPGQTPCGNTCVSIDRDPMNCGGCNQPCAPGSACVNGSCSTGCGSPLMSCNAGATCVDPRNDPANCGGCGMPCPPPPQAMPVCVNSTCAMGVCQPGFDDCNANASDGCEVDVRTSQAHCGGCGQFCNDTCVMGQCCGPLPAGSYQATCTGCEACNGVLSCLCNDGVLNVPASTPLVPCPGGFNNCNGVLQCNAC